MRETIGFPCDPLPLIRKDFNIIFYCKGRGVRGNLGFPQKVRKESQEVFENGHF